MNLSDKTRAIEILVSDHNSYDADLKHLEAIAPGHKFVQKFRRVNQFNKKELHEKLVYILLSFKSVEELEQFRLNAITPVKSEKELRKEIEDKVRAELAEAERLRFESDPEKMEELQNELEQEIRDEMKDDLESEIRNELKDELQEEVREQLKEELQEEVKEDLKKILATETPKKKVNKKSSPK